jgi:hypothetical protein
MEVSNTSNTLLQSTDKKLTENKVDETAKPEHGGGGVYIPPKSKESSDTITISNEATQALNEEQAPMYHGGGGVYVPPKGKD